MELKVLTTADVCKLLHVSLGTLRNWEHKGVLVPKRIGRRNYYLESDIVEKLWADI